MEEEIGKSSDNPPIANTPAGKCTTTSTIDFYIVDTPDCNGGGGGNDNRNNNGGNNNNNGDNGNADDNVGEPQSDLGPEDHDILNRSVALITTH